MRLKLDINLDDESEVESFIKTHGTTRGRSLANRLNLSGHGAVQVANAFSNYAWNKATAMKLRKEGNIANALTYEQICDIIYTRDINPLVECW